jgi:hypothetical protein
VLAVVAALGAGCEPDGGGGGRADDTAWQLGVFRGSMRPDYVAAHEEWLGRRVAVVLEMIPSDSWKTIENPAKQIRTWADLPYEVVFTTPMLPDDGSTLAAGAAGAYDDRWRRFAQTFVDEGRPDALIRLGHEFNHTFYPWAATSGREPQYAAYFRHVVDVTRSVEGSRLRFVWNVLSGVKTANVTAAYPGDDHVDVISLDVYDGAEDVPDFDERWARIQSQPFGLNWLKQFAADHDKPMAFDEWALVKSLDHRHRDPSGDSGDNTVFIEGMLDFFESEDVLYANYFDWKTEHGWTDSRITEGPYPNASAVYLDRVGRNGEGSSTADKDEAARGEASGAIALVVGDAAQVPAGDVPLRDRLGTTGTVVVVDDDALRSVDLSDADLVVLAPSVEADKVPRDLSSLAVPILNAEALANPVLGLATDAREQPASTALTIADATHPVAGGVRGTVDVQTSASMATGVPAPGAGIVARAPGGDAAVWVVDPGARLTDGVAPARRAAVFLGNDSAPALSIQGWTIVDAAIAWLLG